ncbi:MAG: hypothetical protein IJW51_03835 [Clostridia bacterium]|nr:hypothetical protein [Clostridia bacterium]
MKETLEKLWNEYFAEICALIHTKEEKELVKKAGEIHKTVDKLLTKEQSEAVEKYVEVLYEIQGFFVKKAFFNGCKFATSFLFEIGKFGNI